MDALLPVLLINLARRPDRLAFMRTELAKRDVAFTIVEAVDGADPAAQVDMGPKTGLITGRERSRLDYACVTSHRRCWQEMISLGLDHCIVLEDDVVLADDFSSFVDPSWIPADADLVKLETVNEYVKLEARQWNAAIGRKVGRLRSRHLGAGGYLIGRRAAELLLAETKVPKDHIDHILFSEKVELASDLCIYQVDPAPVIQGMYHRGLHSEPWAASTLDEDRHLRGFGFAHRIHAKKTDTGRPKRTRRSAKSFLRRAVRKLLITARGGTYSRIKFG